MIEYRSVTHAVVVVIGCFAVLRWQGFARPPADAVARGYLSRLGADPLTTGFRNPAPKSAEFPVGPEESG